MKKSIILILALVFVYGCSVNYNLETNIHEARSFDCCPQTYFKITIPDNYLSPRYNFFLDGTVDYYRFYKNQHNNSIFYFDDFYLQSTLNTTNIINHCSDSVIKEWKNPYYFNIFLFKCRNNDTTACQFYPPTMDLHGIDSCGLYWRSVRYKWYVYGYQNVPENKKDLFDSIIGSLHEVNSLSY